MDSVPSHMNPVHTKPINVIFLSTPLSFKLAFHFRLLYQNSTGMYPTDSCYMPRFFNPSWFGHPNYIWQESGSRNSNSPRAGWSGVRTSVRADDFSLRQNLSRPAWGPTSLLQWVLWFFPEAKRLGRGVDYPALVDKAELWAISTAALCLHGTLKERLFLLLL
jgi:hypothetical protein